MAKDFEQIGYKNLELLRFYLSKELREINKKINKDESEFYGYIIASLVDILIVVFFNDILDCAISSLASGWQILCKMGCVAGLLTLFVVVKRWYTKRREHRLNAQKKCGADDLLPETQLETIDDFDNIACDGLLICQHYIERYKDAAPIHVKRFYFYEIIHHLRKAEKVFNKINSNPSDYINPSPLALDSYRVNNFIEFAKAIYQFIKDTASNTTDISMTAELKRDIENLGEQLKTWKI